MELRTIFSKPVDRTIEGVIKADDEASLRIEVDEYGELLADPSTEFSREFGALLHGHA